MDKKFITKEKITADGNFIDICPFCEHPLFDLDSDVNYCPYCGRKIVEEANVVSSCKKCNS